MEYAISTSDLHCSLGKKHILKGINLNVPLGSIYGFLGPNGAGKTTTIRVLLSLIRHYHGSVHIMGNNMKRRNIQVLRKMGTLIEMPSLYPHLSGRDNLEITRRLLDVKKSRIDEVLEIVQMKGDAHRKTGQYSLGMKQRLGLALALLGDPELLILDEPTNGLDPAGIVENRELLKQLNEDHGKTIFLSSHLLSEIKKLVSHVGIIHQGSMTFEGSIDELNANSQKSIRIATSANERAQKLLQTVFPGISASSEPGMLDVPVSTESQAALINRMLVEEHIDVYRLQPLETEIESIFMSLTTREAA